MSFLQASTVEEALTAVQEGARPIAGGSDLVVGARQGKESLPESLVAIDRIDELARIEDDDGGLRIGAGVTHRAIIEHGGILDGYTALADGSALIGSPSTRNVGTLGGNVMNASPAMDTGAPLVVLGASVVLQSATGTREIPIADLWVGPGETSASSDELCVAVMLPGRSQSSGSAYLRLEFRRAMEIAIVGAAATVTLDDGGNIADGSVALAAVAPTIVRVDGAADLMRGLTPDEASGRIAGAASEAASPISDIRASERYRRHTVGVMASRAVLAAALRAAGEVIEVPANKAYGVGRPA